MRKISISARDLLIESTVTSGNQASDNTIDASSSGESNKSYTLNSEMVEFIRAIRNKYRVYLLTRLETKQNEDNYDTK